MRARITTSSRDNVRAKCTEILVVIRARISSDAEGVRQVRFCSPTKTKQQEMKSI